MDGQTTINTIEEFIDKCTPSEMQIFDIANIRCGFDGEKAWASMIIAAYNARPLDYLTYDAQEVKEYLVSHNLYRSDSYEGILVNNGFLLSYPDARLLFRKNQ
jgi:hypothetical protein